MFLFTKNKNSINFVLNICFPIKGLEHLPNELKRNFTLMRDLDTRACNVMKSIDEKATVYMKGMLVKECPEEDKKKEKSKEIQNLFNKAKQYGDDKVQLAIQTYELVDKHIRRLDSDLARFEVEIQDKTLNARGGQSEEETVGKSNIVGKKLKGKLFNKIFTEGRKKGKDTKATGKKKRSNSSEDESRSGGGGGGNGSTVNKNKKQKVIHEKEARKGQKVKIIFHFHHFC